MVVYQRVGRDNPINLWLFKRESISLNVAYRP